MRISIIGTGYVGLISGVCLASKGHDVICVDNNKEIVESINNSEVTIFEPYLEEYLKEVIQNGKLEASSDMKHAIMNTEVSIIAVGTPPKDTGIDLSYIQAAAENIGRIIRGKEEYHVVGVKSTVVPTTTDTFVRRIIEKESGKRAGEFGLVMNPEFLREGEAILDFMNPDRIVIGAYDEKSFNVFKGVYEGFFQCPIIKVNLRTAELIKYSSNTLLALLISYSNELAAISESIGNIDVQDVLEVLALDKRISPKVNKRVIGTEIVKYLKAGRGYGGSCFPKDVKAIIEFSMQHGYLPRLLRATITVNEAQIIRMADRLEKELGCLEGKKLMILGLAFKPYTDDVRESQSIKLIKHLLSKNAEIYCTDPAALENSKKEIPPCAKLIYICNYKGMMNNMDAVLLMTAWEEYVKLFTDENSTEYGNIILFDCCRALDKNKIIESGIKYIGTGLT